MKNLFFYLTIVLIVTACKEQPEMESRVFNNDVTNFWKAYDSIVLTSDSFQKIQILNELFLNQASEGQQAMINARRYKPQEYIRSIERFPQYWESIRANMGQIDDLSSELQEGIDGLKGLYPGLKPAEIYFTVGAFRSNGTTMDSMVLIGSELAMADSTININEVIKDFPHLEAYYKSSPKENLVFLNTHEYVHTQQNTTIGSNLLAQTVIEGIPEFLAELALEMDSSNPQMSYGKANDEKVKNKYVKEMYSPILYNWFWNSPDSDFGLRDMGYYIGYKISEGFYNQSKDKSLAVKQMIELDYTNMDSIESFVSRSNYFELPLSEYKSLFSELRPKVTKIVGLGPDTASVRPGKIKLEILFNKPMDVTRISTDVGSMGLDYMPKITSANFNEEGTILQYELMTEPSRPYEMVLHWNMRDIQGLALQPDTIRFHTAE